MNIWVIWVYQLENIKIMLDKKNICSRNNFMPTSYSVTLPVICNSHRIKKINKKYFQIMNKTCKFFEFYLFLVLKILSYFSSLAWTVQKGFYPAQRVSCDPIFCDK